MNKYTQMRSNARKSLAYKVNLITLSFAKSIYNCMKKKEVSSTELSKQIGTSPAYISKVLRGDANYTVETMVKLAEAVGCKLSIELVDDSMWVNWGDSDASSLYSNFDKHFSTYIDTFEKTNLQNAEVEATYVKKGNVYYISDKAA